MWRVARVSTLGTALGAGCRSLGAAEESMDACAARVLYDVAVESCGRLEEAEGESWTVYFERMVETLPCVANGGRPASGKSGFTACDSPAVVAMDNGRCVCRSSGLPDFLLLLPSVGDIVVEE